MPVRLRIPLPGPFVYVPRRRHRRTRTEASMGAVFVGIVVFIVLIVVTIVTLATGSGQPSSAPVAPAALATDPGVTLYTYLHDHGATMPASWAQVVDARHASACAEYAVNYTDYAPGYVDEFGVDAALAHAAVSATGFC
jgi:hypothetical protein